MGANEEHTTDRHDESDREQFGDDHDLTGTHFIATHCQDCGTYCVKAPEAPNAYCIDCRRTHHHITWQSGDNIGDHHPTHPSTTPEPLNVDAVLRGHTLRKHKHQWQWGCIYCLEQGTADNPTHATALHKIHVGYACPGTPGISHAEQQTRIARRKAIQHLYPETTPPYTPT
jgi:hypothetical protein